MSIKSKPGDILRQHLSGRCNQSRDNTVSSLASATEDAYLQGRNSDSVEQHLWTLWSTILTEAESTSAEDDTKQTELVALLNGLKSRGQLQNKEGQVCKVMDKAVWTDLPVFGVAMREQWNKGPHKMLTEQWTNVNAFTARLTAADVYDFELYSIWSLRDALEHDRALCKNHPSENQSRPPTKPNDSIDQLLPAALQWLLYFGERMKQFSREGKRYEQPGQSNDPAALGTLAKEAGLNEGGFNLRRWNFWYGRLTQIHEVNGEEDNLKELRRIANCSLEKMRSLDT